MGNHSDMEKLALLMGTRTQAGSPSSEREGVSRPSENLFTCESAPFDPLYTFTAQSVIRRRARLTSVPASANDSLVPVPRGVPPVEGTSKKGLTVKGLGHILKCSNRKEVIEQLLREEERHGKGTMRR